MVRPFQRGVTRTHPVLDSTLNRPTRTGVGSCEALIFVSTGEAFYPAGVIVLGTPWMI